jgi:hypothetical protein
MKLQRLIWLVAVPLGGLSAQVSLFEGAGGRPGNVVILDLVEERPSALQGIVLLPLECVGRTRLTELLEGRAQRVADVPGAARLLLPGERGSLYKYRRDEAQRTVFGFFVVARDGKARSVLELDGTGTGGAMDPFPGRVAIAADGASLLVASSAAAGGDLWEVDLAAGVAINRTPDVAPQDFERSGLALLGTWGVGVASGGVFRFERVAGGRARLVGMPFPTRWYGPDVVHSADESTVAFLAGDDVAQALVFTCKRAGGAAQASASPMRIVGAGFLPEEPAGPTLALSTDGSWVVWRAEGTTRECFARETRAGTRPPDLHLTGSTHFDYTLNDTGVIAFFDPDSLAMLAGLHDDDGIQRAELFRLDLAPTAFVPRNLTLTSGITQPPFDYGTLETERGLFQAPSAGAAAFVLHEPRGSRLLWVDVGGTLVTVLDRVESLDSIVVTGSHLVADVVRPPGVDDPLVRTLNLVQIPRGGRSAVPVRLPDGCHLSRHIGSRSRSLYAAVLEFRSGERLGRLSVPSANGVAVSSSLLDFGPTVGLSADGAILASVDVLSDSLAFSWSELGTQVLRMGRGQAHLLPGL